VQNDLYSKILKLLGTFSIETSAKFETTGNNEQNKLIIDRIVRRVINGFPTFTYNDIEQALSYFIERKFNENYEFYLHYGKLNSELVCKILATYKPIMMDKRAMESPELSQKKPLSKEQAEKQFIKYLYNTYGSYYNSNDGEIAFVIYKVIYDFLDENGLLPEITDKIQKHYQDKANKLLSEQNKKAKVGDMIKAIYTGESENIDSKIKQLIVQDFFKAKKRDKVQAKVLFGNLM